MKSVDTATATAIEANERAITTRLYVDWQNKGFFSERGVNPSSWTLYDSFDQFALNTSIWTAGGGAIQDPTNSRAILPCTSSGSGSGGTLTSSNFNLNNSNLTVLFTSPPLEPSANTRKLQIEILTAGSSYALFRNDSSGVYMSETSAVGNTYVWTTSAPGYRVKGVTLQIIDGVLSAVYTTETGDHQTAFTSYSDPVDFSTCHLKITCIYTGTEVSSNGYVDLVAIAGNVDNVTSNTASLSIDRNLSGTLPDQVSYVEGASAAKMSADLITGITDDENKDAAWQFSPYNPAGLHNVSKTQRVRVGAKAYVDITKADGTITSIQKFVGTTRDVDVSVKSRTADLVSLDKREQMTGTITLPIVDGAMQGLNASAFVSFALQKSGLNIAPPIRDNCKIYMPMHGTMKPMVGGYSSFTSQRIKATATDNGTNPLPGSPSGTPEFIQGPFFKALNSRGYDASATSANKYLSVVGSILPQTDTGLDLYSKQNAAGIITVWLKMNSSFYASAANLPNTGISGTHSPFACSLWTTGKDTFIEFGIESTGEMYFAARNLDTPTYPLSVKKFSTDTVPTDGAWHLFEWQYDMRNPSGRQYCRMRWDNRTWVSWNDTTNPFGDISKANSAVPNTDSWSVGVAEFFASVPVSDVQISSIQDGQGLDNAPASKEYGWVGPGHDLNYSSLELTANTHTDPQEAWDLVTTVASAERAHVFFDEAGLFHYRPLSWHAGTDAQTLQKTVTSLDHITEFDVTHSVDTVRNVVTGSATTYQVARDTAIFSTTDTFELPAGKSTIIHLNFDKPVSYVNADYNLGVESCAWPDSAIPWPGYPGSSFVSGVMSIRKTNQSSTVATNKVSNIPPAKVYKVGPNFIELIVSNPNWFTVWISNDGQTFFDAANMTAMQALGSPSLILRGTNVIPDSTVPYIFADSASINKYGEQNMQLSSNEYIQNLSSLTAYAGSVLGDLKEPVPTAKITVIGDPRLELGDRIRVQDPEGNTFNDDFWIQGIGENFSPSGGYTQNLTLRKAYSVLYWALDTGHTPPQDTWDNFVWG